MSNDNDDYPILPSHVDETVRAIAKLHARHRADASSLERALARLSDLIRRPRFTLIVTLAIAAWIGWNLLGASFFGVAAFDPPPFFWLETAAQIGALYVTLNILAAQRRDDELAELRERLALHLAILNEQKTAKIIHLLGELRRDFPGIADPADAEAEAMSSPSDAAAILEAIMNNADGLDAPHEGGADRDPDPET